MFSLPSFQIPSLKLPKIKFPSKNLPSALISGFAQLYLKQEKTDPKVQKQFLMRLIRKVQNTAYGIQFHFNEIKSYEDFAEKIPINDYDSLYPWIQRSLQWESDILYTGKIPRFATSSGTTWKWKYIPVSYDSLKKNHFAGGSRLFLGYFANNPNSALYKGYVLGIGWWFVANPFTQQANVGFISAILQKCAPRYAKLLKQPKPKISYIHDRQIKTEKIISATINKNITSITWQPSRCSAFLEEVIKQTWVKNILEIRPNFELVMRGGMAKSLYDDIFQKLLPSDKVQYYQVYNASEGFFAVQDRNDSNDMLLLINHYIFYEFIPVLNFRTNDMSIVLTLEQVELGQEYVIIITNNAGLYRYVLGDTVKFTNLEPFRIIVSGRIKYYIDIVWECSCLEHISNALEIACQKTHAKIKEYTVGPSVLNSVKSGYYQFIIERNNPASDLIEFQNVLDVALCKENTYYYDERVETKMLKKCEIHSVKHGTFYKRLANQNKLGWQFKIPKVCNDRKIIEELLDLNY